MLEQKLMAKMTKLKRLNNNNNNNNNSNDNNNASYELSVTDFGCSAKLVSGDTGR